MAERRLGRVRQRHQRGELSPDSATDGGGQNNACSAPNDAGSGLPGHLRVRAILRALVVALSLVQGRDSVPPERVAARQWYSDARFGMFIHWGVYSLLGSGEWVMQNRPITVPDYEWLAMTFNPTKFDAHAWVSVAKAAGMKYITITSRHHDGFSMFQTRATRYNIEIGRASCRERVANAEVAGAVRR